MGVHGLWKLIESSGQPVPLESLENKILTIDISIWLHKAIKGFQDSKGAQIPNAHLLSIYHRVCKLLYFKVKPVFVFDGGVPILKKETIAKRNQQKSKNKNEADRIHKNILNNLLKHTVISKVLSEKTKSTLSTTTSTSKSNGKIDSLYFLPPQPSSSSSSDEESFIEDSTTSQGAKQWDLHSIDTNSSEFKSLPIEVRHEILTDLKDTRKQSSWGRIHELPTESDDFSTYQMKRLLKRQNVQNALEDIEKEMGGHQLSLGELEKLLKDEGVLESGGNRIASDETKRFVLIKNLKQAIDEAKQKDLGDIEEEEDDEIVDKNIEFRCDLQKAIELSLQDQPSTSSAQCGNNSKDLQTDEFNFNEILDSDDLISDSSDEDQDEIEFITRLKSAQNYMIEYSGLTPSEIARIIGKSGKTKKIDDKIEKSDKIKEIREEASSTEEILGVESEDSRGAGNGQNFEENSTEPQLVPIEDGGIAIQESLQEQAKTSNAILGVESGDSKGAKNGQNMEEIEENSTELQLVPTERSETETCENSTTGSQSGNSKKVAHDKEELKENIEELKSIEDKSENLENLPIKTKESSPNNLTSDSSDDEFVDVEESTKTDEIMEVVIKPDEEMEDDLFSDIFTEEKPEKNHETAVETEEIPKKPEEGSGSMKNKLEKWIQQYSKPQSSKNEENNDSVLSVQQLKEIRENLQKEQDEMIVERSAKERFANSLTDQIYQETQELLELFGVPYIVAPMEAEAQCAFLEQINLVDGTITDDSDIWLFGGKTVYKNFFNPDRPVLEFRAENIQHHFKLTRYQMVLLALLVGSDYTVGLPGIGPVTALEILAAFPPKNTKATEFTLIQFELISGLKEFRQWCEKGKLSGPGPIGLRNKLKNLQIHHGFPNVNVIQAYLEPNVETSDEKFTWSKPDVVGLCDFAKRKFGWTIHKSQEILKPVLKRMNETKKQMKLSDYYQIKSKNETQQIESKLSKRVQTALNRLNNNNQEEVEANETKTKQKSQRKKKIDEDAETNETKTKQKRERKKKIEDEDVGVLKQVQRLSRKRLKQLENEMKEKQEELQNKKPNLSNLKRRETIPQKQRDKTDMLRNKLKAIEAYRRSKQGPGYVRKSSRIREPPKKDAGLSESSSSD